jgi:hypothetical protein
MCLLPTSAEEVAAIKEKVATNSVFIEASSPAKVFFRDSDDFEWKALVCFGPDDGEAESAHQSIIKENCLEYVGTVALSDEFPFLRIADPREAHYIPKCATTAQVEYAAKKAGRSVSDASRLESWDLCERLSAVEESFRLEFWTGLDPAPLLQACEEAGLIGWYKVEDSRNWSLPAVPTVDEVSKQLKKLSEIKTRLNFKCGFDFKASNFIYDICQATVDAAIHGGAEYPSNQGVAVVLSSNNDGYRVCDVSEGDHAKAFLIEKVPYDDRHVD